MRRSSPVGQVRKSDDYNVTPIYPDDLPAIFTALRCLGRAAFLTSFFADFFAVFFAI
jgi:hypothetical protein